MSCERDFFRQLRECGFRLTPQREMVLSVLHQIEGFTTAEDIYDQVHAISTAVDISTIYRTLELLQDFHLVASVDAGDGERRYELLGIHGQHLHLACHSCGEITGVDLEQFQSFIAHLKEQYGFEVGLEQLSIPGICQRCSVAHDEA